MDPDTNVFARMRPDVAVVLCVMCGRFSLPLPVPPGVHEPPARWALIFVTGGRARFAGLAQSDGWNLQALHS